MDQLNPREPSLVTAQNTTATKLNSLFDALPSKSTFWLGFATAILTLGTLGFILLGGCLLSGKCNADGFALGGGKDIVVNTNDSGTPTAQATSVPAVSDDDHKLGPENAEITLVEYSDFECPYCGTFHPTLQEVMKNYEGKIRWVYRHFPLSFHPNALPAANAAECASEQGKFWEFADKFFANQDKLGDAYYRQLAGEFGLNVSKWEDCYKTQKYNDKIQSQAAAGGAAGVTGTPGSFIVGKDGKAIPIQGALPYASVAQAIDQLLGS